MLCTLLVAFAAPADAHQLKAAQTSVALNPGSGLVEVIHRFYVHDAEHAVEELVGIAGDIHRDVALRDTFARYVAERFVLTDQDGHPLPAVLIGSEIDGDFLWIYEELPGDAWPEITSVRHDALHEFWPEQENRVNVRFGNGQRTVVLRAGDGLRPLPGRVDD